MRRSRHKLQVSTFPFLAVLLCAMGSLILFLLVMDRRAKIVAQNKANAAAETQAADFQAQQAARRADRERHKQTIHAALTEEQQRLQAETRQLQARLDEATKKLAVQQADYVELRQRAAKEKEQVAVAATLVKRHSEEAAHPVATDPRSSADLARMTRDVRTMEQTLKELRYLKRQEGQTYSVVPYRGTHGAARKPVYVECRGTGLLLHPDRLPLEGRAFTVAGLRGEVERRAGGLKVTPTQAADAEPEPRPYVLFLIRPDGVANYYRALSFLKGFELDFGTELVDAAWTLDFSADAPATASATASVAPKLTAPAPTPTLPIPPPQVASAGNGPGNGTGPGNAMGLGKEIGPGNGTGSGNGSVPGLGNGNDRATDKGSGTGSGKGPSMGSGTSGVPGLPFGTTAGNAVAPAPLPPSDAKPGVGPATQPGGPPSSGAGQRRDIAPSLEAPPPAFPEGIETPAPPLPLPPLPPLPPPPLPEVAKRAEPEPKTAAKERTTTPVYDANGQRVIASTVPEGGTSGESNPLARLAVPGLTPKAERPAPPPSRVLGARDFVVTVDCYGDHVTVFPGGVQFRWKIDALDTDARLRQYVATLIQRRQASVAPGEPPYRPLLQMRVALDGLRAYLRVYPLLEYLRVPMTRENLED